MTNEQLIVLCKVLQAINTNTTTHWKIDAIINNLLKQGKPTQPKLIGWRTADYLYETSDPELAKNWSCNLSVLPIFEGDAITLLKPAQE